MKIAACALERKGLPADLLGGRILRIGLLIFLSSTGTHAQVDPNRGTNGTKETVASQEPVDVGKLITFSTIGAMGSKCGMMYGGPSLGTDRFLIEDCGDPYWAKKWDFSEGYIRRMSFSGETRGWFLIGNALVRDMYVECQVSGLQ